LKFGKKKETKEGVCTATSSFARRTEDTTACAKRCTSLPSIVSENFATKETGDDRTWEGEMEGETDNELEVELVVDSKGSREVGEDESDEGDEEGAETGGSVVSEGELN